MCRINEKPPRFSNRRVSINVFEKYADQHKTFRIFWKSESYDLWDNLIYSITVFNTPIGTEKP